MKNQQTTNKVRTEIHRDYLAFASLAASLMSIRLGKRVHQYEAVGMALEEWVETQQSALVER